MTTQPDPFQNCRNCNGTGHLPVSLSFAGICTHCVNGRVRTEQRDHVLRVDALEASADGVRVLAVRTDRMDARAQDQARDAAEREFGVTAHLAFRRLDPADPTYYFTDRVVTYV